MPGVDATYKAYVAYHCQGRSGEALRRLQSGLGVGEKVCFERVLVHVFGDLKLIIPEYPVTDFKDGRRYVDFYVSQWNFGIEVDGYTYHLKDLSPEEFSEHLQRQNDLLVTGVPVLRFSYQDVRDSPRECQRVIQQLIGRLNVSYGVVSGASFREREILRLAVRCPRPITPGDAAECLGIGRNTAARLLHDMVAKGFLIIASGSLRARVLPPQPRFAPSVRIGTWE